MIKSKVSVVLLASIVVTVGSNYSYAAKIVEDGRISVNPTPKTPEGSTKSMVLTLAMVDFDKKTGMINRFSASYPSIIIPKVLDGVTVKEIGGWAFYGSNLTSVTIPDSVTTIGASAFANSNLTSVTIPDSVTTIGAGAFAENKLTSVTLPDSVTTIGGYAFGDNNLTSVTIPDSVTAIGDYAFYNNKLTSMTIPDSVTTIGKGAFNDNALSTINNAPSDGFIFARNEDGTENKKVVISYGGATKEVTIPDSVTTIGEYAFYGNELTSATLPDSVTTIGEWAFGEGVFDDSVKIKRN